jgi:quinol monooxygenase YgiN
MIIMAGWARIKPEARENSLARMQRMVAETRAEPGCLAYTLSFDISEPDSLRIFEIYKDGEALAAHRDSAHLAAWRDYFGDNVIDRAMAQYRAEEA